MPFLGSTLYYVENISNQHVPNYTRFDVRLGWQPQPSVQLSLGVRNLLDNQHFELSIGKRSTPSNEIQRAIYFYFVTLIIKLLILLDLYIFGHF